MVFGVMRKAYRVSSSALYSLKGLHIEVKAIALLKKKYPDIKLYVPGGCAETGK